MKICVAGTGYVGLSLATLLSEYNEVWALNTTPSKAEKINNRISPIKDEYIEKYFAEKKLNLTATTDYVEAIKDAEFVIIATPTNYAVDRNCFDTTSVEDIIEKTLKYGRRDVTMVIKSTIPVGYTESIKQKYGINNIFFSPEFLREGKALYDSLHPSRIIVGDKSEKGKQFAALLKQGSLDDDTPVKFMDSTEAEAVKLFANTYLAMRVAYFNELDTYAELKGLNTKDIIDGMCLDPRIGDFYNNPSFGYGGYCLPKDTKELRSNYQGIPQRLISAIIESNDVRKSHITNMISNKKPKTIGIYRLIMKSGSDNFRASAIQDIMRKLKHKGYRVVIYEPTLKEDTFEEYEVINDFDVFKEESDVILVNRQDEIISKAKTKVYTRDLFVRD